MRLSPPEVKIKVKKSDLVSFQIFCARCAQQGFTGTNYFVRVNPVREELMMFHMKEIIDKVNLTLGKHTLQGEEKMITLKLNHAERITLSFMMRRIEFPNYLALLEYQILHRLEYHSQAPGFKNV